jgi:hypothetical protein
MAIRLVSAFALGWVMYMIAMAMTVYDGGLSLIFQPIVGGILCLLALTGMTVVGSPLLIPRVWGKWRRVWGLALLMSIGGVAAFVLSWHPSLRVTLWDPELQASVESFHPILGIGGWLAAMFGVVFCPLIGVREHRRRV